MHGKLIVLQDIPSQVDNPRFVLEESPNLEHLGIGRTWLSEDVEHLLVEESPEIEKCVGKPWLPEMALWWRKMSILNTLGIHGL